MAADPAPVVVRRTTSDEADWIADKLRSSWGSLHVVSRGRLVDASVLPAFVAISQERAVGLATYHVEGEACELVTIDAFEPGVGAGSALLDAVATEARAAGCRRMWLVTTNDNTPALRFYQRHGLRLVALRVGAIDASRRLKPEIPATGIDGIPIRDELELELLLDA